MPELQNRSTHSRHYTVHTQKHAYMNIYVYEHIRKIKKNLFSVSYVILAI